MKFDQLKPAPPRRVRGQGQVKVRLLVDIKAMREKRGVTLRQCEQASGISNALLSQIEHGMYTPRLDTALRLASFLQLPVESIWALKGTASK